MSDPKQRPAGAARSESPTGSVDEPARIYARLPDRIKPEDMITEQAAGAPADPTLGGVDSDRNWLIRYA